MARSVAPWWWTSLSANGRKRKSRSKPTFSNSPTMLGWDHFGKVYRLKAANVSAGGVRENAGRWDHQARGTPKLADGFILHFCWHPAPNRFQPCLAIDQSPLPP